MGSLLLSTEIHRICICGNFTEKRDRKTVHLITLSEDSRRESSSL